MAWVIEIEEGRSHEKSPGFLRWLDGGVGRRETFDRAARGWKRYDALSGLNDDSRDTEVVDKWLERRGRGRRWSSWLMAAAALAAAAVGVWTAVTPFGQVRHVTPVGRQDVIELPDASVMMLNTNSVAVVDYSEAERRVVLKQGEAHFEVAADSGRPFVVIAGEGAVRAVGTAFNVRLKNDVVEVTVTEGAVQVVPKRKEFDRSPKPRKDVSSSAPRSGTVSEGQRAAFREDLESVETVPTEEIDRKLAWREGLLVFSGESLAEVVQEISRYTDKKIVIADRELDQISVTARLRTDDIERLLKLIASNDAVDIRHVGRDTVYIVGSG